MADYTEFDARQHEAFMARIKAEKALRDHQPVAQTVADVSKPLKPFVLSADWLEEDRKLEAAARTTYAAWATTVEANPRNQS